MWPDVENGSIVWELVERLEPSTAKKAIDDEEFEEFPVQEWAERTDDADDEEMNVWEDNWDDETHESDFSKQLKVRYSITERNDEML
ncbi:DSS1/SEM1 family protein [Oesophagostomum dentatum]|uniref:26S proteasome complex subunit dss-1 n=1 Tax=Oesophagostomum dentatum TaxID=61180 RepID=A0A0B1SMI9_OESDE|nr:DSS1/SEM1 family protein [Oesophagostomum dentatum]